MKMRTMFLNYELEFTPGFKHQFQEIVEQDLNAESRSKFGKWVNFAF